MSKKPVHQVIAEKCQWHYQPTAEEQALGFKGWYSRGYLPHFDAPGTWQFITYRLADSIPAGLSHQWAEAMKLEDDREKFQRIEFMLDHGFGACPLRQSRLAQMVQDNLWFHDGKTYRLLAWVVMPNHLHILAEMWKPLAEVLRNWKAYTANQANKILEQPGESFWQKDYFDRYIRDQEHYRKVVHYIESNPVKAGLVVEPAQWPWSSAPYRNRYGSDVLPEIPKRPAEDACAKATVGTGARTALSARIHNPLTPAAKPVRDPLNHP